MMDLKTFSQADFDPKIWINKAWSSNGNQEKEVFVANAVSRLQLYMKQLTNSLDETTTQIVTSLPRVVRDAELVREEGLLLQSRLLALEERVERVEEQTGHSIESLQRIDKLKSKLENAASTLHEADKWAVLTASLENILEVGVPPYGDKLNELSEQVTAMTQSLEVLSEASDYDSKRVQLETLYNRLEAAISAPMIDAISQMDPVRTCAYVRLVSGMGRRGAAGGAWRRAAAARLAADWRRLDAHAQPALTRLLAACAPTQIDWLTNVLQSETPLTELIRLYTDLLLSLDPSPSKVASAALKECATAEERVNFLIDLRRAIDEFVTTIKGIIDTPRTHQETIKSDVTQQLIRTAYLPLKNVVTHYATFENQLLQAKIGDLDQDDLVENSRAVLSVAQRCEAWLEAAYHRGRKIGARAVYPLYIQAVQEFVSMLTNVISSCARRVEATFLSSVSAGQATGVLSDAFTAALVLESAATTLLDAIVARHEAEAQDTESKEPGADVFDSLFDEGTARPAVDRSVLSRTRDHLATLARNILKEPVETQLEKIPVLSAWSNNDALSTDLPDFALSPQEYITEIGQYVMTLPLHLEMLVADKQAEWQYLSEVCVHTCDAYAQKILTIRSMDQLGTRRCLTDIAYLSSVVEDLGSGVTPALRSLESSLRAAAPDSRPDQLDDAQ